MTTHINRRTALAAVAAVPAAVALGATAAQTDQDLESMIAEHKTAMRRLTAASKRYSDVESGFTIAEIDEPSARAVAAGVPEANDALVAAYDAEEEVRVRLVLHAPANAQEAARKKRYIDRSEPFRFDWHHDDSFLRLLLERINTVAS